MICDTSGILSAFSADQPHHTESATALRNADARLVSPGVLTEIDYLASRQLGHRFAAKISVALAGPEYQILAFTEETLKAATEIMATYTDLDLGLVDASLVIHARDMGTDDILTLDQRHFRSVRSLSGRHFRLLPFDVE